MSRTSGGSSGWDDAGMEGPPPAAGMRLAWPLVLAGLWQAVEQRLGGRVVEAVTQPGGFSPGWPRPREDGGREARFRQGGRGTYP